MGDEDAQRTAAPPPAPAAAGDLIEPLSVRPPDAAGEAAAGPVDVPKRRKRKSRDELEARVRERTAELESFNLRLRGEIKKRRRIEAILRDQKELLIKVLDNIPVLLCLSDEQGRISPLNREFLEFLGPTTEGRAAVLKSLAAVFPKSRPGENGPPTEGGGAVWRDVRVVMPQGRHLDMAWAAVALSSGDRIGIGIDLSDRVAGERERLRLAAAIEQAMEAIAITDARGVLEYVNPSFEAVSGLSRSEALGRPYAQVQTGHLAGEPDAAAPEITALASKWTGRRKRRDPAGGDRVLDVAVSPVRGPEGAIIGYLISERDVTREVLLQQQIRQVQKMEALGTLAGGIAHDFNNLLQAITINTELTLYDAPEGGPAQVFLPQVLEAAGRGKELVKQIITFSRQKEKERQPVRIGPVLKEALKFLRASLPATIEIRDFLNTESDTVLADPTQIHQILMNLASNAAHAMRAAGGVLDVRLDADDTGPGGDRGAGPRQSFLRLTVKDTGTGMTPEVLERIFDPFFTTKAPGEGTGLGLSVVLGIVKSHRGAIEVSSEPGAGTIFRIYLPRVDAEEAALRPAAAAPVKGEGRVLLVEDETSLRDGMSQILRRLGYQVTAVDDPREALEMLRLIPDGVDLVITDQTMPHMTGLQLSRALLRERPDLPIVLCTGYSDAVDGSEAAAAGVRAFLMKPFTSAEIAAALHLLSAKPAAD